MKVVLKKRLSGPHVSFDGRLYGYSGGEREGDGYAYTLYPIPEVPPFPEMDDFLKARKRKRSFSERFGSFLENLALGAVGVAVATAGAVVMVIIPLRWPIALVLAVWLVMRMLP